MTCRKNRPTCHWLQANNQTLERSLGWLLFHFYSFLFLLSFYNWYFEIESTRYSYISHFLNHWRIIEWSLIIHDPPGYYWLIIGHHGWIINTKWRRSWFHAVCMIGFKPNQLQITVGEAKATTFSQKHGTVHRNFHGCIKRHCPFWDACAFKSLHNSQVNFGYFFWIFILRCWVWHLFSTFLDQDSHGNFQGILHLETLRCDLNISPRTPQFHEVCNEIR